MVKITNCLAITVDVLHSKALLENLFSDQLKKIIKRYKKVGYNMDTIATVCMSS